MKVRGFFGFPKRYAEAATTPPFLRREQKPMKYLGGKSRIAKEITIPSLSAPAIAGSYGNRS